MQIPDLGPNGKLDTVGRHLGAVTLELPADAAHPASGGGTDAGPDRDVRATLAYTDEDAAAFSEITVREILGAITRQKPKDLGWLSSATVDRPGKHVIVTAPLPPAFVDALLKARSTALAVPPPP